MRVLVVEDDTKMATLITRALQREGYVVQHVSSGADAVWAVREFPPDAVVLDAMIPEPDGFEVCRAIRRFECWAPVIMVTGRDAVSDRVAGLDAGADDYLVKPFSLAELLARLRALLRRDPNARPTVLRVGELTLDPATKLVARGDIPIDLTPREYELLKVMMSHPGRVLTRGRLLRAVWGTAYADEGHYLHVYVSRLRRKLGASDPAGGARDLIVAEPGVGYRIRETELPVD